MPLIVAISGSPSSPSRSTALAHHVSATLQARGFELASIAVRELPAAELLTGRTGDPVIAAAIALVERAMR